MYLPSKGFLLGSGRDLKDPKKLGPVMWSRSSSGCMIPFDLVGRITVEDEHNLNHIFEKIMARNGVKSALEVVVHKRWDNITLIKPYLIETLRVRTEARSLIASGDWDEFWNSVI